MRTLRHQFVLHLTSITALLAATVISLITTLGITEELGDFGAEGWWRAVAVSVARIPEVFYESLPYAVIIGSATAFALMDRGREMTVLRTSGLGIWMASGLVLQAGLPWGIAHALVGELVMPPSARFAKELKLDTETSFISAADDVWLIDGPNYVRIGRLSPDGRELRDVTMFTLDADGRLESVREIRRAVREEEGWAVLSVREKARADGWRERLVPEAAWDVRVTPQIIESFTTEPRQMSAREIWGLIRFLESNRQEDRLFPVVFWSKLAASLSIPLLMLTGLCFVTYRRHVSVGGVLGIALLLTLGYYLLTQIALRLTAQVPDIPVAAGALAPVAAWVGATLAALAVRERR